MKVCIVGAGAIGGFLGARLAASGADVTALARGETLRALREDGWRLQSGDVLTTAPAIASDRAADLGPQDLVVLAVKSPALPGLAPTLGPLLGKSTAVMPAMNGVPWWFCHGVRGFEQPLQTVDPGGAISRAIDISRVVGCVVHASASSSQPGCIRHHFGRELIVGEPLRVRSERVRRIADLLAQAGFEVTVSDNIRQAIWYKLWGNMTVNPISAITGATGDMVIAEPLVRAFCSEIMREAAQVGACVGCEISQTPEDRHAVTGKLGAFRPSMLQDVESGRTVELDALVGAVHEIAGRVGVGVPSIGALLGLARLFARVRGLLP